MHWLKVAAAVSILLAAILLSGFFINRSLERSAHQLEEHINLIEKAVFEEEWGKVRQELPLLQDKWKKMEKLWTLLLYHDEIDNITMALSKMNNYIEAGDRTMTLGEAALLRQYIRHIPEKETFSLKNIF